jgi:hypothetical protein
VIQMNPEYHRSTRTGASNRATITVELNEEREVGLLVESEDDVRVCMILTSEEAHALSGTLAHFASRSEVLR